ncbi:uncharacterized protein BDR25DRAFT_344724 [Lindgomyces ingoldianus]|uniref:Uncharacterized protein n=1 Tax=Lindgomyces ingoldianus TaxID=673940 RepID=A0ACB6QKR4_9PLEO|nr:uncharacterized protein BDR25DRAFT_344724 [Lindgomyces ingoldianus]KAF2467609.1 hypothetical protein BDR25DRAFT_344724 [Lindgomyces ingoldianus]
MALSRAVSSRLGCRSCRNAIVSSFIPSPTRSSISPWRISCPPFARPYTLTWLRLEESNGSQAADALKQELKPSFPEADKCIPVPWYLQAARKRDPQASLGPRRELIPDLPPNPPPLLPVLLHYISMSAGLDDLLVLDLRHLDPPPALGSKLIMIIGTARSEKHLHVSADRMCRYLRRTHNLKANAAGLLGRNELKIKQRRKAKRMRLLANVGGQEPVGDIDDGIRTNWICCTVGRIQAHPDDTHIPGGNIENFVGFREASTGVNVVVQMFTEEKRAEIDLETLWGGVVKTHGRENQRMDEKLEILEKESTETSEESREPIKTPPQAPTPALYRRPSDPFPGDSSAAPAQPRQTWNKPMPSTSDIFPPASSKRPARQARRMHTSNSSPA